jgi:hypothetical protein
MAASISLLLIKRISHLHINPKSHRLFQPFLTKSLSTSPQSNTESTHEPNHKPSSLSSRLSFVFDQIDAIEKRHSEKDETLERIRAWRQSKQTHQLKTPPSAPQQDPDLREVESVVSNDKLDSCVVLEPIQIDSGELSKEKGVIELVHPWPEWMELMERLVKQNYFDHRRERDDDDMVNSLGIDVSSVGLGEDENVGVALFQDFRAVQNACSNFGKDRFDILRSLSRNDIQILVGHGCPATDRKVVFSGKLLRKRVHLDEGDVSVI